MTAPPLRFLIDENLSPALAQISHSGGYEASHLRDLGLLGKKDWSLLEFIQEGDWILVTLNVEEFRERYRSKVELHAGVVFIKASMPAGPVRSQPSREP